MNDYMQGYEGIKNKVYDKEVELQEKMGGKDVEKRREQETQRRKKLEEK